MSRMHACMHALGALAGFSKERARTMYSLVFTCVLLCWCTAVQVPSEEEEVDEDTMEELQAIIEADYEVRYSAAAVQMFLAWPGLALAGGCSGLATGASAFFAATGWDEDEPPLAAAAVAAAAGGRPPFERTAASSARGPGPRGAPATATTTTTAPQQHPSTPAASRLVVPQVGATIREKLIPRGVSWYTGEAIEDEGGFQFFPEDEDDEDGE